MFSLSLSLSIDHSCRSSRSDDEFQPRSLCAFNTIDTQAAQARSMVVIHPFMDGNGRLSRVMAVWALARHGWRKELCFIPLFGQRACISRRQYIQSIRAGRTCPCSEQSPDTLQKCEARCCSGCHREESGGEKFLSCSRCSIVRYCSRRCQKRDWKRHKLLCHEAGGI